MVDLLWVSAEVKRGSVVLISPTGLPATAEDTCGLWFLAWTCKKNKIPTSVMIFIAYIYKCNPTYRVTLTANPTHETKHQTDMAPLA